jgi:energy-coupling factor transporter ATP-binding protein EcfA2
MSLTHLQTKDSVPVAYLFKDDKLSAIISYDEELDSDSDSDCEMIEEKHMVVKKEPLKRIKVMRKNEFFFPIVRTFDLKNPKCEQVDKIYICGPGGCGKTTWIRQYISLFKKKYPKSEVLLFSSKDHDKKIDDLGVKRLDIDDEVLQNPFTMQELSKMSSPVLTIFDDIENFGNKKINIEIARLRDEILTNGRSYGIFCLYVHHDPCDYKSTKTQIFEANKVIIFPKRCGQGTYDYLLEKKLHIGKKTIGEINSLKSNWICINKGMPNTIISDKYILLNM